MGNEDYLDKKATLASNNGRVRVKSAWTGLPIGSGCMRMHPLRCRGASPVQKRGAEMQDLWWASRSDQITQDLAGADPTCHILTSELLSAYVSTTKPWPCVINARGYRSLHADEWMRGATSVLLPHTRLKSRESPPLRRTSRPRLDVRISPWSSVATWCSGWELPSSRPSCPVVSARREGSTRPHLHYGFVTGNVT